MIIKAPKRGHVTYADWGGWFVVTVLSTGPDTPAWGWRAWSFFNPWTAYQFGREQRNAPGVEHVTLSTRLHPWTKAKVRLVFTPEDPGNIVI